MGRPKSTYRRPTTHLTLDPVIKDKAQRAVADGGHPSLSNIVDILLKEWVEQREGSTKKKPMTQGVVLLPRDDEKAG